MVPRLLPWLLAGSFVACGVGERDTRPADAEPPRPATVRDGFADDIDVQDIRSAVFANWDPFPDPQGSPVVYEWAIGTGPGGEQVQRWTAVGGATSGVCTDLELEIGAQIWCSVRGTDLAGNRSAAVASNGFKIVRHVGPATTPSRAPAYAANEPLAAPTQPRPVPTATEPVRPPLPRPTSTPTSPPVAEPAPAHASSLSQWGITWTFDREHRVGRFANGDWWVLGPVAIVGITPGSSEQHGRTRHGSMIDPDPSVTLQGYDSTLFGSTESSRYDPSRNVALGVGQQRPLWLPADSSLVSTITHAAPGNLPQLQTCAILTCLAKEPPADAFRPAYCGHDKAVRHRAGDLDLSKLGRLPLPDECPDIAHVAAQFERPWLDHINGWIGRYLHPSDNMPDYGRELADAVSTGALLLQLDLPDDRKRPLLIRMTQLGIDLAAIVAAGGRFAPDGGSGSGRKFPIMLAGTVLRDPTLLALAAARKFDFGEDAQTFYVEETAPGVFNQGHGGYTAADKGLAEWGNSHADSPANDNRSWGADTYRRCCTANAWHGFVLAARIMGLRDAWGHDPLFDYVDRYMATETAGTWTRSWSRFPELMWDRWRAKF
ncbi:MAG: hypothetical protein IPK26_01640 [Planctomycetes bacterium]|nr:hypothetical protein [Planctomycetota bacterium]